jgi:hypothetical protein
LTKTTPKKAIVVFFVYLLAIHAKKERKKEIENRDYVIYNFKEIQLHKYIHPLQSSKFQ